MDTEGVCFYPKCTNHLALDRTLHLVNNDDPVWSFMPAHSFMHLECYIDMMIEKKFLELMKEYKKTDE